jgi:hypothetical protein
MCAYTGKLKMKLTLSSLRTFLILLSTAAFAQNAPVSSSAEQTTAQLADAQSNTDPSKIRYVTAGWNWQQLPPDDLAVPGSLAIHLKPCPPGLDAASKSEHYEYNVYIDGSGTPEAVPVIGGSCPAGTAGGTIMVRTAHAHKSGYRVGSASSGIQEAWNAAWTSDVSHSASNTAAPYVKLMAGADYSVKATVYLRGRGGILDGAGAYISCSTRDRCIKVGTASAIGYHKLYNLTGGSTVNVDGAQVSSVSSNSGLYTITTAANHPFVVGDSVDCEYHSQLADQHWISTVTSVPAANSFTVQFGRGTFPAGTNTFGFCALENTFIEDGSEKVVIQDINITQISPIATGQFTYGIVNDNDQQLIIERAANRGSAVILSTANFPMAAFVYERNDQGAAGITYLHNSEFTNVNCVQAGGNGLVVTDSVCQGFPTFGIRYFGGFQPATIQNLYEESTGTTVNPLYRGSAMAGQMGMLLQGGTGQRILGTFPISGSGPVFLQGGSSYVNYFVVPRSSVEGYGPVLFIGYAQPVSRDTKINLQWPSIDFQDGYNGKSLGTITWDILATTGLTSGAQAPFGTGIYAVATNVPGSCGANGMCSYSDPQAERKSYAVQRQQYNPKFWFWPANLTLNNTTVIADVLLSNPAIAASQGVGSPAMVASLCLAQNQAAWRSPVQVTCLSVGSSGGGYLATLMDTSPGTPANSKGRLNFGGSQSFPNDVVTLFDSNFNKTAATAGSRPSADVGDIALGADQTGGLAERAPASISRYIKALNTGTGWMDRLTAEGYTLNANETIHGNLSVSGNITTSAGRGLATIAAGTITLTGGVAIAPGSCRTFTAPATGADPKSPHYDTVTLNFNGDVTSTTGFIPASSGMLTINPWLTANQVNVKECNGTSSSVTPQAVTLIFRVMR